MKLGKLIFIILILFTSCIREKNKKVVTINFSCKTGVTGAKIIAGDSLKKLLNKKLYLTYYKQENKFLNNSDKNELLQYTVNKSSNLFLILKTDSSYFYNGIIGKWSYNDDGVYFQDTVNYCNTQFLAGLYSINKLNNGVYRFFQFKNNDSVRKNCIYIFSLDN